MKDRTVLRLIIAFLLTIYILQGVIIGLITTIPLYLDSRGATWEDQSIFNFALYPFTIKLAWAPFIDAWYSSRIGRRKSWLVPIQLFIGLTLLLFSFYLPQLIEQIKVKLLTCIFCFIYFLLACQDICIDGWALNLLANYNLQWASTCQTVGQTFGQFIGFTVLMTLESAKFTNQYIRKPLSLPEKSSGLFTLDKFVGFWAAAFLCMSIGVIMFPRDEKKSERLSLLQTYISIVQLFKKKCVRQLILLLLLSPIGYAATFGMTNLVLKRNGVTQDAIGLLGVPLTLVKILIPFSVTRTTNPLKWYYYAYFPRLFMCIPIAIYVCLTPMILNKVYYYPLLIFLFIINEALIYLMLVSRVGFYARISDPSIGGTYITLLSTIGNLGASLSISAVYRVAACINLPKFEYPILVGICLVLGLTWMSTQYSTFKRLQALPVQKWHLSTKSLETDCIDDSDEVNVDEERIENENQSNSENKQFVDISSKPLM